MFHISRCCKIQYEIYIQVKEVFVHLLRNIFQTHLQATSERVESKALKGVWKKAPPFGHAQGLPPMVDLVQYGCFRVRLLGQSKHPRQAQHYIMPGNASDYDEVV